MKKMYLLLCLLTAGLFITSCNSNEEVDCPELRTDTEANINQFLGKWYEIASFPQFFNPGCECTTAEYSIKENGRVEVFNSCKVFGFIPNQITGEAYPADDSDFSKLFVKFPVSPSAGDYWIIEFEADNYILVGNPARDNLYILSRTPNMDDATYNELVNIAQGECFDVSKLKRTPQNCGANI